jgi:hypothetical protein
MVHLAPIAAVMAPRSDASCWCISARSCIADISLGGQDLLDRTGDRSLETYLLSISRRYDLIGNTGCANILIEK